MAQDFNWKGRSIKVISLSIFILLLSGITSLYAQGGHVVILDTMVIGGLIKGLPIEDNTAIYYKKFGKDVFEKISVNEVSEFSFDNRFFYRHEIKHNGILQPIFLERLITAKKNVSLYKLNDKPLQFFIEKDSVLQRLEDKNQLLEALPHPGLENLITSTKLNEHELLYLFKTASEKNFKPRTFTNTFVFTPYFGVSNISHKFHVVNLKEELNFSSSGSFIGINLEAFLNFKRNLSLNFSPQLISFQNHSFYANTTSQLRVESDLFLEYTAKQIPLSVKYYQDIKPQKLRLYGEFGYVFSKINFKKAISYDATIIGNEVYAESHHLHTTDSHAGFVIGIGAEKYLFSHRGLVFGLRYLRMEESFTSSITQIQLSTGFKF